MAKPRVRSCVSTWASLLRTNHVCRRFAPKSCWTSGQGRATSIRSRTERGSWAFERWPNLVSFWEKSLRTRYTCVGCAKRQLFMWESFEYLIWTRSELEFLFLGCEMPSLSRDVPYEVHQNVSSTAYGLSGMQRDVDSYGRWIEIWRKG